MSITTAAKQSLSERLGADAVFPVANNFEPVSGVDLLLQDIQLLLCTTPGERVMRPDFGCNLKNNIWENIDSAASLGASSIKTAITNFEPRINLLSVQSSINRNTGLIIFQLNFIIISTNVEASLVFPYRTGTALSFA